MELVETDGKFPSLALGCMTGKTGMRPIARWRVRTVIAVVGQSIMSMAMVKR
jgi:hypothetical protein